MRGCIEWAGDRRWRMGREAAASDEQQWQWMQRASGGNECRTSGGGNGCGQVAVVAIMNGRALAEINAGSIVGGNDAGPGGGDIE